MLRSTAAILGLAAGLLGLGLDYLIIMPSLTAASADNPVPRSFADAFVTFWTYFTHLANLGLVLVYAAELTGWRWLGWFRQPVTQALMGGFIMLVMLFYHFMLAPYYHFEGGLLVATILLHYVAPLYYLGWWTLFARHGALQFRDLPAMLLPGIVYVAWVLLRGLVVHAYPYDILDAGKHGYGGVAVGTGILIAAVALFCTLVVLADRWLGRRAAPG